MCLQEERDNIYGLDCFFVGSLAVWRWNMGFSVLAKGLCELLVGISRDSMIY